MNLENLSNRESAARFSGAHGYRIDGDRAVLSADLGFRAGGDAGHWALQLWACEEPYAGGLLRGIKVAEAPFVRASDSALTSNSEAPVEGQQCFEHVERSVEFNAPPAGRWQVALVLSEWTCDGYVTRDFCNFPVPFEVSGAVPGKNSGKASIQTASIEQLMQVKGIDSKLAKAIVRARPFSSLEDLVRVRGIGHKLLRQLRPALSL